MWLNRYMVCKFEPKMSVLWVERVKSFASIRCLYINMC